MFETHRIPVRDNYPCPACGGVGSIYKTIRFDENGKSIPIAMDFVCLDCDQYYEINRQTENLFIGRSIDDEYEL